MIVVDTNVIAYLLIPGPRTIQAEMALNKDPFWVAPLLWRSELRNVLILYMRQMQMQLVYAQGVMQRAEHLFANKEYHVTSDGVLQLAGSCHLSSYDCEFVFLAQKLGTQLLTVDKKIISSFPQTAVSLEAFTQTRN